jgi:hypothetical protein
MFTTPSTDQVPACLHTAATMPYLFDMAAGLHGDLVILDDSMTEYNETEGLTVIFSSYSSVFGGKGRATQSSGAQTLDIVLMFINNKPLLGLRNEAARQRLLHLPLDKVPIHPEYKWIVEQGLRQTQPGMEEVLPALLHIAHTANVTTIHSELQAACLAVLPDSLLRVANNCAVMGTALLAMLQAVDPGSVAAAKDYVLREWTPLVGTVTAAGQRDSRLSAFLQHLMLMATTCLLGAPGVNHATAAGVGLKSLSGTKHVVFHLPTLLDHLRRMKGTDDIGITTEQVTTQGRWLCPASATHHTPGHRHRHLGYRCNRHIPMLAVTIRQRHTPTHPPTACFCLCLGARVVHS